MNTDTQKIGKYVFVDGILLPQTIEKGVLAYFYCCTPPTLRSQLQRKGLTDSENKSKTFTKAETEEIFAELGPVYYDSALDGWKKSIIEKQKSRKRAEKSAKTAKNKDFFLFIHNLLY